ncbi:MAG: bifunctional folylpolyglutamate synthase/dihydrofolate synthase, partial [Eubacteriales Family XIII. Incertae Sedis bacterium]
MKEANITDRQKKENAIEKIGEFHRFGSILGLERMNELMKRLGNPEKELKCIHVAGTNGKGSVCRFIYSALLANGYSVGIYTSPYLTVFNERIELDGEYISDSDLAAYTDEVLEKVSQMTEEGFASPTEFEVITAIAFLYFARKGCDYAVMEVGLGGRGDSTNIIEKPLACVITSISYDHTDRLGNTLAEIAREKAGIIKPGAPVIMNVDTDEAKREIA